MNELRVLIVDDSEDDALLLISELRRGGFNPFYQRVDTPEAMAAALDQESWDVIFSDYVMPKFSGLAALELYQNKHLDLPFIMISGQIGEEVAIDALKAGVHDFILKNNPARLIPTIKRELAEVEERHKRRLAEIKLRQSMDKLKKTIEGTILAMARIIEIRDPYTAGHQMRVAELVSRISRKMGMGLEQVKGLRFAAIIHDVGKISIPSEILSKPGTLGGLEFDIIKTHPQLGYDILKTIKFPWPVAQIVLQHHERLDGSGYPQGLTGGKMLLEAQILAVADVVDAMASHRPYRPAQGIVEALAEVDKNRTILYEGAVVEACLKACEDPDLIASLNYGVNP